MKGIFLRCVSLLLVVNVMISTTGIGVLQHLCECHPDTRFSFLPGYVTSRSECCCADIKTAGQARHETSCQLAGKDQCRDIRTYVRKEFMAENLAAKPRILPVAYLFQFPVSEQLFSFSVQDDETILIPPEPPHQVFLKRIILFHTFRTSPSEPCSC